MLILLIFLVFTYTASVHSKRIEDIHICLNESDCDESEETENYSKIVHKAGNNEGNDTLNTTETTFESNFSTDQESTTEETYIGTIVTIPRSSQIYKHDTRQRNMAIYKRQSEICECDLTVSSCDINCCCDMDCDAFHLTTFSHCKDYHPELYDSRYCYDTNFIERNNTPFILEKLADNLFCILYDNLPPSYYVNEELNIQNRKDLTEAIDFSKPQWKWEIREFIYDYNFTGIYQDGDFIWILKNNYIQPLDLPQTGFTALCSFKMQLKYLQAWTDICMQVELTNENAYLFPRAYNNFTVIPPLILFNKTYLMSPEQTCSRNACLTPINHYCRDSWSVCNKTEISGYCSNENCHNIVKAVKYVISHNGSLGISNIHIYFKIVNVSSQFYQNFEVSYKWIDQTNETFTLSGNPGYMRGKPLIIGTLKTNKSNTNAQYISFNKSDEFLTLPLGQKNQECNENADRYVVVFGENVKLRCSVTLKTNNFSTASCVQLQNYTFQLLMKDSMQNITQSDQYTVYVSKLGNFTNNDKSNWTQILLDRIPQNIISGQVFNNQLWCSGLITSIHLHILYSTLTKSENLNNYNILGIGITFSDEIDVSWPRCISQNCSNILKISISSYVTFHDISKPSRYYFASNSDLDIALPYDFFYPFLNNAERIQPYLIIAYTMISNSIFTYF